MKEIKFSWPKKGDLAFKPSVLSKDHRLLDAFIMHSTDAYSEGYKRAGDILVAYSHSDDLNPDNLFFPVAFVYRHHLELLLKELIRLGERVGAIGVKSVRPSNPCPNCGQRKGKKDWRTEHNLLKLWNRAKRILKSVWPDSPRDDLEAVERVILEFNKLDRTGQAFRDASTTNGVQSLRDTPEHVDLENLAAVIDAVSTFLYSAWIAIDNCDPGPL